ncbi:translocation/assembly module TamB domain-containing protein [Bauldia sp.]|uniref:translocation/assembly module TamB domain-containing protein n=1 Tax=Bauldia sp. TaxID=2575872 RepID=UPI003BA89BDE
MGRALRYIAIAIAGIVALVALVLVLLATPPGRSMLAGFVERTVSGDGLTLSIGSLSGWPPFSFGADTIVLADDQGTFAEIDNLAIDLNTPALLRGQLAFDTIAAGRVAVHREPVLAGSGSGGEGGLIPLAARSLTVTQLELGAGLVGRPAAFAVDGAFAFGSDGAIQARLDASRIDSGVGTVAARVARASGGASMAVDLSVEEASDGVLLGLMGRETGPGYRLVARSSLTGDGLDGAVSLTSDGDARFSGRFGFTNVDNDFRLTVNGEGDLAELVPPGFTDLLAGRIELTADVGWSGLDTDTPQISVRDTVVSTETVRLTASGEYGFSDSIMSIRLEARRPDGRPITLPTGGDSIAIDGLTASGRVAASGEGRRLDLVAQVAGLATADMSVPGIGLSLAVETETGGLLNADTLPFAIRIEADAVDLPGGRLTATDTAPLLATADGTFDPATASASLDIDASAAGGQALFTGEGSAAQLTGEVQMRIADLAELAPIAGQPLSGAVSANANGTFFGPEGISLSISGTATDLDPGAAMAASLLAGESRFALTLADSEDGLEVTDLTIGAPAFTVGGDLSLGAGTVAGALSGDVTDLAALAPDSSGAASFSADVSGALARPTFDVRIGVADGRLAGQPIADAELEVSGGPVDNGWRADLALSGAYAGRSLSGSAEAMLDSDTGRFVLPTVNLAIAENRLTGSIEQTPNGFLVGSLALDAPDLTTLAALALLDARGSMKGDLRFSASDGRQTASLDFNAGDVAIETIVVDTARGDVRIDDLFGMPQIGGTIDAAGIAAGSTQIDRAQVSATIDDGTTLFSATAAGPGLDLSGSGSLSADGNAQVLRLTSLDGAVSGVRAALVEPASIRFGDQVRIESAVLTLGGGRVSVGGTASPQLNLAVRLNAVSASVVNTFAPDLRAQGTISGSATVTGTTTDPTATWQINWTDFGVAQTTGNGLPGLSIAANGDATANATTLTARLTGGGLALDVTGSVPFDGRDPNLRAQGSAPLELLGLFTDRELELGGLARIDVSVAGPSAISGTVSLTDATIVDADTKFGVAGVAGDIRFDGQTATIPGLTGRMAQGGAITVSGRITVDPTAGLPADLTIDVRNGRYSDGTMIDASYTAGLALTGPLMTTGSITGQVDIARAEVLLPDHFGGGVALNVEHINVEPGFVPPIQPTPPPTAGGPQSSGGLNLDITVAGSSRSAIIVRGFGLDAELGGSLRITGTTENIVTVGGFEMLRGRIEVLGRRFDFTRGRMTFAGDLVPILDFEATTRASDITANVLVTGPADDPEITFTSTPELPEEEIISHLLFDRNVGSLTAFQAAQLVDAIGQFSGAFSRGDGLFARARKITGLDDIDIRQNESGGTTVGIGKRINDNLRLGVEQDTSGTGRVTIDLDLTRNLKARGEAGGDGSGKIGLTYEREY